MLLRAVLERRSTLGQLCTAQPPLGSTEIQRGFFSLDCPTPTLSCAAKVPFEPDYVAELEEWIDEFDAQLPPLRNFILPSGSISSTSLHVARSVSRGPTTWTAVCRNPSAHGSLLGCLCAYTVYPRWRDERKELLSRWRPQLNSMKTCQSTSIGMLEHLRRYVTRRPEATPRPHRPLPPLHEHLGTRRSLSDFLFTAARLAAKVEGAEETVYRPPTARGGEELRTR